MWQAGLKLLIDYFSVINDWKVYVRIQKARLENLMRLRKQS